MGYISQIEKKELAPAIKQVLKKYNMKGTIAIYNHMELIVNLKSGSLDLISSHNEVQKNAAFRDGRDFVASDKNHYEQNTYYTDEEGMTPEVSAFFTELVAAMKGDRWFNIESDYHHVPYYLGVNVGSWDKPYICTAKKETEQ